MVKVYETPAATLVVRTKGLKPARSPLAPPPRAEKAAKVEKTPKSKLRAPSRGRKAP